MVSAFASLLRVATIGICVVTVASFGLYAINQTDNASAHQQQSLATEGASAETALQTTEQHTSGVRGVIDEVSNALTSPFDGVTSNSHSEWVKRGVNLAFALVVYGFGLGFTARFLRVRS
jgi:predicted PurR-regulated permease PerM